MKSLNDVLDRAREQIQSRLLADGGGPKKAPAFRTWKSRTASESINIAYIELKAEGRIKADAKTIEWVDIEDIGPRLVLGSPPVLTPERAVEALNVYKSSKFLMSEIDAVKCMGHAHRMSFMAKVRRDLYHRGIWRLSDAWFRSLGEYLGLYGVYGLYDKYVEALISDKITLGG